jgi:hypothetical protein
MLLLEGELLVGLVVGAAMTSSFKIMKRHELLLHEACQMVVEFSISGVEDNLSIRRDPNFVEGFGEEGEIS